MTVDHTPPVTHLASTPPIWEPDPERLPATRITAFTDCLQAKTGDTYPTYQALWEQSVTDPTTFWSTVMSFFDVLIDDVPDHAVSGTSMPDVRWYPGAHINYAENALRRTGPDPAIITESEDGATTTISWDRLRGMVGAVQHWLRSHGVRRGDRVVGYLPNTVHTVVAALAATGLGAIWAGCGQDYGPAGAHARLGQLEPVVLIAADGYRWNGTLHDRRTDVAQLAATMPTLRAVLHVPTAKLAPRHPDLACTQTLWDEVVTSHVEPTFDRVEFNDPLWVLFSSGTTGIPKGILHSHGGVVLDHYKLLGLHNDLNENDRFFWYTTTNWMMWNLVLSGLLVGATIVLYDGSPTYPSPNRLWDIAATHRVNTLGVSPGYVASSARAHLHPGSTNDLSALRIIGSTGAPLPASSYHWIRDEIGAHVQVASTSGGTDVVSGFAGSAPTTPVWAGEISAPLLGVDLQSWDTTGHRVVGDVGELVIASPMPSMPISFWNDPTDEKRHAAYFDTYPGVWRHGDWVTITERGSIIISGRSDATLNRHGVRLGSADIYDVVEAMPEIAEALVVGAELDNTAYWMPLFVVMAPDQHLNDALRTRIVNTIRQDASPRHVPDTILAVPAIPHTRTGKKLEVPVKRLIQGQPTHQVVGVDTIDDPDALEYFARFTDPGQRVPGVRD